MQQLYDRGDVDFVLTNTQYSDPWLAARVVAIWFDLMLHEADGDLDAAVRAYHKGTPLARLGQGEDYLAHVKRRRHRYIRNEDSTPTWRFLFERANPPAPKQ
jgi:hypothetical protein